MFKYLNFRLMVLKLLNTLVISYLLKSKEYENTI